MRLRIQFAVASIMILIGGVPTVAAVLMTRKLFQEAGSKPIVVAAGIFELALCSLLLFGVILAVVTLIQLVMHRKRRILPWTNM